MKNIFKRFVNRCNRLCNKVDFSLQEKVVISFGSSAKQILVNVEKEVRSVSHQRLSLCYCFDSGTKLVLRKSEGIRAISIILKTKKAWYSTGKVKKATKIRSRRPGNFRR